MSLLSIVCIPNGKIFTSAMLGLLQVCLFSSISPFEYLSLIFFSQGVGQKLECAPSPTDSSILIEKHFPTRFSIQVYLICWSVMMFISFLAFLLLWRTQPKQNESNLIQLIEGKESTLTEPLDHSSKDTRRKDLDVANRNEEKTIDSNQNGRCTSEKLIYLVTILWTTIWLPGCISPVSFYPLNPYGTATFQHVIILCRWSKPIFSLFLRMGSSDEFLSL